jgi:hypothetical protein
MPAASNDLSQAIAKSISPVMSVELGFCNSGFQDQLGWLVS